MTKWREFAVKLKKTLQCYFGIIENYYLVNISMFNEKLE